MKKQHDSHVNNFVGDTKVNPRRENSTSTLIAKSETRTVSHLQREEIAAVWQSQGWDRQMNLTVSLQICV